MSAAADPRTRVAVLVDGHAAVNGETLEVWGYGDGSVALVVVDELGTRTVELTPAVARRVRDDLERALTTVPVSPRT